MTTVKHMGLAGTAMIGLGGVAAYYAAVMALQDRESPHPGLSNLAMGLLACLVVLVLIAFWRSVRRSAQLMGGQIKRMLEEDQVGLVMDDGLREFHHLTKPLNELLSQVRTRLDDLRAENRELEIQSRIADAEKQHTEAIIFSISDAVIVTNRFDELILSNRAAEELLAFKLDSGLRKNIDQLIADGTLVRLIRETRNQGRSHTRKVVEHSIDRNGEPRTFSITLSCIVTSSREVSGVVAVLHDITREKEIAKLKTDFVSNVSHELKTPLSSIKAYVEMLIDGEAPDEQTRNEFYSVISAETDRLHRLIENILNISRIESGVVKVVREPVSLSAIVKQVMDVASLHAKQKSQNLAVDVAPVYHQVEADRDMVYQAVLNLVSNAVKYTPPGGRIHVSTGIDERRKVAFCQVADTGKGIPANDLPHVFDKFYRVRANNGMAKGTGLGLTLVKHIIETVHDGRLSVTSEEGKGSTFCFELPIVC